MLLRLVGVAVLVAVPLGGCGGSPSKGPDAASRSTQSTVTPDATPTPTPSPSPELLSQQEAAAAYARLEKPAATAAAAARAQFMTTAAKPGFDGHLTPADFQRYIKEPARRAVEAEHVFSVALLHEPWPTNVQPLVDKLVQDLSEVERGDQEKADQIDYDNYLKAVSRQLLKPGDDLTRDAELVRQALGLPKGEL